LRVAIADIFLKVDGVTGEAGDTDHKGEIEIDGFSWGMQANRDAATGMAAGKTRISELMVVKKVDQSSPTLMKYCRNNKPTKAKLTVRKAGKTALEYLVIELEEVRVVSIKLESEGPELVERVSLGFAKIMLKYVPQAATGARGGGDNIFETDALATA
jgi:type VI secretion system secreted protein Hcp